MLLMPQEAAEVQKAFSTKACGRKKLVESYGPEISKEFYTSTDKTHLTILEAAKVAELAIEGIRQLKLPLSDYLK